MVDGICQWCGTETKRFRSGRHAKFCSLICNQRFVTKLKSNDRPPCSMCHNAPRMDRSQFCSNECRSAKASQRVVIRKVYARRCDVCGVEFSGSTRSAKTCSAACRGVQRRLLMVPMATCGFCGNEFRPRNNLYRSYCSRLCAARSRAANQNADSAERLAMQNGMKLLKKALRQFQHGMSDLIKKSRRRRFEQDRRRGVCEACSASFDRNTAAQKICLECRANRLRAEKKSHKLKRKDLLKASMTVWEKSKLSARAIWSRDSKCYLCGRETVIGSKYEATNELYANADHIVPLSRGGKHCVDNLRIACRKCNLAKSDMTEEEFLSLPPSERDLRRERYFGKVSAHG